MRKGELANKLDQQRHERLKEVMKKTNEVAAQIVQRVNSVFLFEEDPIQRALYAHVILQVVVANQLGPLKMPLSKEYLKVGIGYKPKVQDPQKMYMYSYLEYGNGSDRKLFIDTTPAIARTGSIVIKELSSSTFDNELQKTHQISQSLPANTDITTVIEMEERFLQLRNTPEYGNIVFAVNNGSFFLPRVFGSRRQSYEQPFSENLVKIIREFIKGWEPPQSLPTKLKNPRKGQQK